jgi:hypothetical protein
MSSIEQIIDQTAAEYAARRRVLQSSTTSTASPSTLGS